MELIRGPIRGAQKACLFGPEGIGKSTLASKFPDPVFIDTEGSTKQLDVARFPFPTSWAMLLGQVDYVKTNPTICKTVIIDTVDWAEKLCVQALCAKYNKSGIEDFGYGKGYVYLAEEFGRFLNLLNDVIERGIHVVFVAHAQMRKFEQPDEAGAYDRWELKLEKKTAPLVKEWADLLLFCNYKTYVVDVDGTKKAQGGKRVMYTSHHPCWDAKNRHGLPDEIPMDWSAIAHVFGGSESAPPPTPTHEVLAPEPAPQPKPESEPPPVPDPTREEVPPQAAEPEPPPERMDDLEGAGVPKALADLMRANNVTLEEIQKVVAKRGYFPEDTPFRNYPADFVEGVLIAAWPQVLEAIEDARLPF